jgi:hypothetical protein
MNTVQCLAKITDRQIEKSPFTTARQDGTARFIYL